MNFGKTQQPCDEPLPGGVSSTNFSSNEQSVPVPWWIGPAPLPLTWIIPEAYNVVTVEKRQKVGKKNTTVGYDYYADVAGIAGLGLGRRLRWLECDGEIVWQGNIERPDNPADPNYHGVSVTTEVGTWHVTWGRWDQPEDKILLGPLGAKNPALRHPAYRGQIRVVIKRYYCGSTGSQVPNTRICMEREPVPAIGNFPAQNSVQGESIVAGWLELATHPIFGAELPPSAFPPQEWETVARDVVAAVGCHAPFLDTPSPLRDVAKDFATYYDGFFRLEEGCIRPGFYPRNGTLPANLTTLGVHDFVERPQVRATSVNATFNAITVTFRDRTNLFAETPASGSASDHVEAVDGHEPESMKMLAIIDPAQAQRCADEAADLAAEGTHGVEGAIVRTARAVNPDGSPLLPGDNAITTIFTLGVEVPVRVTRRVDNYRAEPELDLDHEPGCYPKAPATPADARPAIEVTKPRQVEHARVLELTAALAGTPLGLIIAVLAKRPISASAGGTMTAHNVVGFSVWYSPAGASYDWLGMSTGWAVRGVTAGASLATPDPLQLTIALDADNIDLSRIDPQSATAQNDDTLLLIIDDEIFSVGAININAYNYTLSCLRARCGSLAAAHAAGAEAWLVFRDELTHYTHATFAAKQTRNFKLQPYATTALELEDADPLVYQFRDRGNEAPKIAIDALPAAPKVGVPYQYKAAITDINGDLHTWRMAAERIVDSAAAETVQIGSGTALPLERASLAVRGMVTFPRAGKWQIVVTASDAAEAATEARSAIFDVAARTDGSWGDLDLTPPAAPEGLVAQGGFEALNISWSQSNANAVASWDLCIKAAAGQVAEVTHGGLVGTTFVLSPLAAGAKKYIRARAVGGNGIPSAWSAEVSGTTLAVDKSAIDKAVADTAALSTELNAKAAELGNRITNEIRDRELLGYATETAIARTDRAITELTDARKSLARTVANMLALINGNYGDIQHLSEVLATADEALARDLTALRAAHGATHADLLTEIETRARDDLAEAAARQQLAAYADDIGDSVAYLETQALAQSTALQTLAQDTQTLFAKLAAAEAAINSERTTRAGRDDAFSLELLQIYSLFEDVESSFTSQISTNSSAIAALGNQYTQLTSRLDQVSSAVTTQSETSATKFASHARMLSNVMSLFGDAHAALQTLAETLIDADGNIIAQWGVKVDAGGKVAEVSLTAKGGANPSSELIFDADVVRSKNHDIHADKPDGWGLYHNGRARFRRVEVYDAILVNTLPPPSIDPAPHMFENEITITPLVANPDHYLVYSTDGSPVSLASRQWPGGRGNYQPVTLDYTITLRVRCYDSEGRCSDEIIGTYVRAGNIPRAATPVVSPNAAAGSATHVTIACATSGATIKYCINGAAWAVYAAPVPVAPDDIVVAYAEKQNYSKSASTSWQNYAPAPIGGDIGGGGGGDPMEPPENPWGKYPDWWDQDQPYVPMDDPMF